MKKVIALLLAALTVLGLCACVAEPAPTTEPTTVPTAPSDPTVPNDPTDPTDHTDPPVPPEELLWEEHSELFWTLVNEVVEKYKNEGLWGTVVRTCLGPEDPSWYSIPDKILKVNNTFRGNC